MTSSRNHKKKLIVSYKNLSEDLLELFKEAYPEGYKDYLQKTIKPNGDPIFVVPLETDDTTYMIKFDVKIDSALAEEEIEKSLYGDSDEAGEGEEFAPISEAIEKEEEAPGSHREKTLNHGSYEELLDEAKSTKKKKSMEIGLTDEELEALRGGDDDEYCFDDEEEESAEDGEDGEEEDFEPSEEDILNIDAELIASADLDEDPFSEEPLKKSTKKSTKGKESKPAKVSKSASATKEVKAVKPSAKSTAKATPSTKPQAQSVAKVSSKASKPATAKKSVATPKTTKTNKTTK